MRRCWVFVLLVFSVSAPVSAKLADDGDYTSDSLSQVLAKVQASTAVLVDVREPAEWERGHLEGASLLPLSNLLKWDKDGQFTAEEKAEVARRIPSGKVVYTHCAAGKRSVPAGEILKQIGYDVRPLKAGYAELIKAGFPKAK